MSLTEWQNLNRNSEGKVWPLSWRGKRQNRRNRCNLQPTMIGAIRAIRGCYSSYPWATCMKIGRGLQMSGRRCIFVADCNIDAKGTRP